jgi:hypothetical protein
MRTAPTALAFSTAASFVVLGVACAQVLGIHEWTAAQPDAGARVDAGDASRDVGGGGGMAGAAGAAGPAGEAGAAGDVGGDGEPDSSGDEDGFVPTCAVGTFGCDHETAWRCVEPGIVDKRNCLDPKSCDPGKGTCRTECKVDPGRPLNAEYACSGGLLLRCKEPPGGGPIEWTKVEDPCGAPICTPGSPCACPMKRFACPDGARTLVVFCEASFWVPVADCEDASACTNAAPVCL